MIEVEGELSLACLVARFVGREKVVTRPGMARELETVVVGGCDGGTNGAEDRTDGDGLSRILPRNARVGSRQPPISLPKTHQGNADRVCRMRWGNRKVVLRQGTRDGYTYAACIWFDSSTPLILSISRVENPVPTWTAKPQD